ncbi:MAG: protein jag [Nitriliruptoraceae bacterium]
MSRTIRAQGGRLEDALRRAVEDLLGQEVTLELRGAGVPEWEGQARFEVEVGATVDVVTEAPLSDDAAIEDVPAPQEASPAREEGAPTRSTANEGAFTAEELDEEADAAADFLEGLLDAMDLPGDLRIKVHEDHVEIEVIEIGSGALIGRRGQTLDAIQELVRCSLQRQFQRRSHVKVDAEGYRSRRLEKLLEKADEAIDLVLDTGEPQRLEPMDVFERKAVHHLVAEVDGLSSRSQGREPSRRVVIEAD